MQPKPAIHVITGRASTFPFVPKERDRPQLVVTTAEAKSHLHKKT